MKKIEVILLCLIFMIGATFRIIALDKIPVSLTIDEVGIAYDSYSILKTGKDQFGTLLPLQFRSIGDYKLPVLIYSMVPAIAFFGLTEFGTRITIALMGSLTILLVFALVRLMLKNNLIALFTAFSLAISPWHIKFSRSTFEAILALFFVLLGVYLFLRFVNGNSKKLWLSAIFFVLSVFTYHSEKVFVPVFCFGLAILYRDYLLKFKKELILAVAVGLIFLTPVLMTVLSKEGATRGGMTFITQDFELFQQLHRQPTSSLLSTLLDNNLVIMINFWAKRYLDYFDLNFLFLNGMVFSLPKSPDVGLLHLYELPLFIIGLLILLFRNPFDKKTKQLIVYWLLIGPLAASLANNSYHPLRSLTLIPIPQLFVGIGFYYLLKLIKNSLQRKIFFGFSLIIVIYSLTYYLAQYFIIYQKTYGQYLMEGWKDAAIYAMSNHQKYKEVVIDPRFGTQLLETVGVPYLYVLFYGKVEPKDFQQDPRRISKYSTDFSNFTFRDIDWTTTENSDQTKKDVLFIGSPWVLPANENQILQKFDLVNGQEILRAVTLSK
jgi:4-amino-4-deoxy-L-arabinose transferase-like glycosyltransferase